MHLYIAFTNLHRPEEAIPDCVESGSKGFNIPDVFHEQYELLISILPKI